jgi:hypothetical protein
MLLMIFPKYMNMLLNAVFFFSTDSVVYPILIIDRTE